MAAALANTHREHEAEAYLEQLRSDAYRGPAGLVPYFVLRGDINQGIEWASKAVDQRYTIVLVTLLRPFEPLLRESPAWPALLKKMNL
jgi:hypothetical protein